MLGIKCKDWLPDAPKKEQMVDMVLHAKQTIKGKNKISGPSKSKVFIPPLINMLAPAGFLSIYTKFLEARGYICGPVGERRY